MLEVVQDRFRAGQAERGRVLESLEAALRVGRGRVNVHVVDDSDPPQSSHVALLERRCTAPSATAPTRSRHPSLFSFNSPVGACETCRGFGRTIGIDYGLVIPDESKSLRGGRDQTLADASRTRSARRTWRSSRRSAASRSTLRGASSAPSGASWVIEGEGEWTKGVWYGVQALLRLARDQVLQDARARAAVALPRLYAVHDLRRRAAEARGAAVACRRSRARRYRTGSSSASGRTERSGRMRRCGRCPDCRSMT